MSENNLESPESFSNINVSPYIKNYDLWYKDVGENWLKAHDDRGNLIQEDYWEKPTSMTTLNTKEI